MASRDTREERKPKEWVVEGIEKFKPIYDRYIRPHIELDDIVADDDDDDDDGEGEGRQAAAGEAEAPPAFDPRTPTAEQFWNEAAARASGVGGPAGVAGDAGDAGRGVGGRAKALGAEEMLKHLVEGSAVPLSRLCKTLDATLDEVSGWIGEMENRRRIGNLVHLLDAQTQLLMSQHRLAAVARLSQLLRDERSSPETTRRACSDLLKIQLVEPSELGDACDTQRSCGESPAQAVIVMPQGGIKLALRDACRESMPADDDYDHDDDREGDGEGDDGDSDGRGRGTGDGGACPSAVMGSPRGTKFTIEGKEVARA